MSNMRSANPTGAQKITGIFLPMLIIVLALLAADPAFSKNGDSDSDDSEESENSPETHKSGNSGSGNSGSSSGSSGSGNSGSGNSGSSSGSSGSGNSGSSSGSSESDSPNESDDDQDPPNESDAPENSPGEELIPPPDNQSTDNDDKTIASNNAGTSIFRRPSAKTNQVVQRFQRTQKELARLFVLTNSQILREFPNGGFDAALVRAAKRARRAERAYQRR